MLHQVSLMVKTPNWNPNYTISALAAWPLGWIGRAGETTVGGVRLGRARETTVDGVRLGTSGRKRTPCMWFRFSEEVSHRTRGWFSEPRYSDLQRYLA